MATVERIIEFLDEKKALSSGQSPWPSYSIKDGEKRRVDWRKLFPPSSRTTSRVEDDREWSDLLEFDWDPAGEDWRPEFDVDSLNRLERILAEEEPVTDSGIQVDSCLEPDRCAWYQPIHYFRDDWGIYIKEDCIREHAYKIAHCLGPAIKRQFRPWHRRALNDLLWDLHRASFAFFFLHEQYHHKVESFGIRLHVVLERTSYLHYQSIVYRPCVGTDHNLEEALANAYAWWRLKESPYSRINPHVISATKEFLRRHFQHASPGYRMAKNYINRKGDFDKAEHLLLGRIKEARIDPIQKTNEWEIATYIDRPMFSVQDDTWAIVRSGTGGVLPSFP